MAQHYWRCHFHQPAQLEMTATDSAAAAVTISASSAAITTTPGKSTVGCLHLMWLGKRSSFATFDL